ncbi:MAG: hypothetical protein ACYC1E_01275 [Propionibacteriaceae bacterium]
MENPRSRFLSLWGINGALERGRLRAALDEFALAGLDGVVFHPRFYPGQPAYLGPEYMEAVSEAILHAKSLGLAFWIYDEDGWPSGGVGGAMLERYPHLRQSWVALVERQPRHPIAAFERNDSVWYLDIQRGPGVDYLNPELARRFIELTYERYRVGLDAEAFAYVEGFFDDEPEFGLGHAQHKLPSGGALPWTDALPQLFHDRFGLDLIDLLPSIFFDDERSAEARTMFWQTLADRFGRDYLGALDTWCVGQNKLFTGHVKGEEHPLFQTFTVGSVSQVMRNVSLPGVDALERMPSNNFFARQVSTLGRQFGSGRCMAEAFGGAGWGATPADFENYLLWLGGNGVTDFVLHLAQYRLTSNAIVDWPPSHPMHITWSAAYKSVLARVRARLDASPRPAADTLLIAPQRSIMAAMEPWEFVATNIHTAHSYPDSRAGAINRSFLEMVAQLNASSVSFDVTDERTFEDAAYASNGRLRMGAATYDRVASHPQASLSDAGQRLAALFELESPTISAHVSTPVASTRLIPPRGRVSAISWRLKTPAQNALLVECRPLGGNRFAGTIEFDDLRGEDPGIELAFADTVTDLVVNGEPVEALTGEGGTRLTLAPDLKMARLVVEFRCPTGVVLPFLWLRGRFRVHSSSGFQRVGSVLTTEGPFVVKAERSALEPDLVTDGFPFAFEALVATATFATDRDLEALGFDDLQADAVRVRIGTFDSGWLWRPEDVVMIPVNQPTGRHVLHLDILPNGYNHYGPHHYYRGDSVVVSPAQMHGGKNFADPDDAPMHTHVRAWTFRRFAVPRTVRLLETPDPAEQSTPTAS